MRRSSALPRPFLALALALTAACSDTGSDSGSNEGGASGEAGSSGDTGGSSGSATGGSAGSSGGAGGSGGSSGNATGGSAGSSGGAAGSATGGSAGSATGGSAGSSGASGSGGTGGTGPLCADKTGGAFVDFEIVEETFRVWIENAAFITEGERLLDAGETRVPVFQTLVDGTGCDAQWSWHADPNDVEFADFTIELCDAVPSYIEENKDEWFDSVGQWCPWSARVTAVTAR